MKSENPKRSLRDALVEAALGRDEEIIDEIRSMSKEELDNDLKERGIDIQPRMEGILSRISSASKKQALKLARQQLDETKKALPSKNWAEVAREESESGDLRSQIMQRLDTLQGQGRGIMFRRFERASDEDLAQLLEDIEELNSQDDDS